jgi:hypothetical protein
MRNRAGKIVVDLNEVKYRATASVDNPVIPTVPQIVVNEEFVNENETTYALFPYELNDPPIFTKSIYAASSPISIHVDAYKPQLAGSVLFHDTEGVVKVLAGTSIVLRVEAIQPNVLNVENGIPTLIQKQDDLTYDWSINGASLQEEESLGLLVELGDTPQLENQIEVNEGELVLKNVTSELNGTYLCTVSNDIGEVVSEAIELEVVHINSLDEKYFRQNLVKNAFARDGVSEWTAIQGAISVQPFALREAESELKKPSTPLRQHSVNEIYPHPITIGSNGIKGYDLSTLATENSFYFTRTPYANYSDGGRPQCIVYQDIDVTEIQDLIAGRVFGCNGVRAYIGCVMGNSIEYRAMDVLIKANPNDPKYFYQAAPRLSFENAVLTGLPRFSGEQAYVMVQEFEGNTQLSSRIYQDQNNGAKKVSNVVLRDPLSLSRDDNASFYMDKVRRPAYLDVFRAEWEGGSSTAPIHVNNHIYNPQNLPDGVGNDWLNAQAYTFSPFNAGTTTLQTNLDPVWWPPTEITETVRQEFEWIGTDPTRILNTYDKLFYGHITDPSYKRESYYTYGQYAEYKDAIITALNPRTTKIRISIVFNSWFNGDTQGSYPTLYDSWDRPQMKHGWVYGDPLFAYYQWNSPIGIGIRKSPKILWQTILDNRHIEKLRLLPITQDPGFISRSNARRDSVKNYINFLKSLRIGSGLILQSLGVTGAILVVLEPYFSLVENLASSSYESSTTAEQKRKDLIRLAQQTTVVVRTLQSIRRRRYGFGGSLGLNLRLALLINGMQSLLQDLTRKTADLANYIKNWTPITNIVESRKKREEAWEEMDMLQYERMGKKEPTSMVTALGLVLEPIVSGSGDASTFRASIMRIPTKEQDVAQRPKPINVLQTQSANQFRVVAQEK